MLKKSITIMAILMVTSIITFGFIQMNGDPNADVSPSVTNGSRTVVQTDTMPPSGFPYPTKFNFNYSTVGGMNGGTVGALWLNGKYYFNRWNSTTYYRYNDNGPGGGPGTVADSGTYVGSCRDLATDGYWVYGGNAATSIYRFDPNTMATIKTFTLSGGSTRAIAWDPNRKGFWNTGFSGNLFLHDTNGVLKQQITSTLTGKYGMAFDSTSTPGTAFLWVWNQGTGSLTNELVKYNISTGAVVNTYIFTLTGASIGIAGGCEVVQKGTELLMLCNYQNFALAGYKMMDLAPPVPTGTWTEQTSGITTALYSVSAVNDDVAWIGGAAGKIIKTVNKGAAWTNAAGDLPVQDVYCIYGFDANNALATTSPSTGTFIYKTTNGGTNWTQVFSETGGFGDGFAFLNANTGYFYGDPVGARWSLWKTTNAGTTWDSTGMYFASAGAAGWNNAMFNKGNKIWFGSNTVNLPYSGDGGATWSNQTTPAVNQYAIWFNDANVGLSGGANLNVTTNGGTTWTALTSIGTGNVSGIVGASTSWWFSRQTTAVNFSSDNGATWAAQYTAPAGNFYHLALSRSGATIWGVRSNGGISRYGTPIIGINPISNETPVNYSLSQNYPNPFNPTTKINFALPKSGLVTLKVYDVVGKEVATLVNEVKNVGTYSVDFNASNLSSGIYFYKVSVNGFSEVKKMMLVK